jgi:fido (protein-threonine AMPylation protein)
MARIVEELCRVLVLVARDARDHQLSSHDIDALHDAVFGPIFGEKALKRRSLPGFREEVEFPIWVIDGPGKEPRIQTRSGTTVKQLDRRIDRAMDRFEKAGSALGRRGAVRLEEACLPPAQLYSDLVRIHPFLDGNSRTAWLALNHGLIRCGALVVTARPVMESRLALGQALRKEHADPKPLAHYLAETIKASQ